MEETFMLGVVSLLVHKMEEGDAYLGREGGLYFKFWPIAGAPIRRGHLFEGAR